MRFVGWWPNIDKEATNRSEKWPMGTHTYIHIAPHRGLVQAVELQEVVLVRLVQEVVGVLELLLVGLVVVVVWMSG